MTKHAFTILLSVFALQCFAFDASAGLFTKRRDKCECVGDYKPPKGVTKYFTCKVKKEWETRQHCLPCGRKIPYKVQVITYRDRYSDGSQRTWKCVVAGTETRLGK
ncbi:MAG: hypothetical protein MI807_13795 [Verrucomicrobiales bacterium]|nr:hypothetical protein [Verrucomicrobiales bacterium]